MAPIKAKNTPLVEIKHQLFNDKKVKVFVKQDYMGHSEVQGNKLHKLKYNLLHAQEQNFKKILTFGGAFSNHIAATAAAAKALNLPAIGIIRGEELAKKTENWSHTLVKAEQDGMILKFISRQEYRERHNPDYLEKLNSELEGCFIIPEGGTNDYAVMGFKDLMQDINQQLPKWTHIYTAVGTGGTLSGLTSYAYFGLNNSEIRDNKQKPKKIIGVPVLKNGEYLKPEIEKWIKQQKQQFSKAILATANWELLTQYHQGGYAKKTVELEQFQTEFEAQYKIPLDPIYTSKVFYAFFDQVRLDKIPPGSNIILYHSGGLQGACPAK